MFRVHWQRNGERGETVFGDYYAAKYTACNMVYRMACDWACVTSEETGEILKDYQRG